MQGEQAHFIEVGRAVRDAPSGAGAGAAAAAEALAALRVHAPSVLLVFASVQHDVAEVLRGVRSVAGDLPVIGATTAGEICDGVRHGSVVAVAIGSPHLSVRMGVAEHVSADWEAAAARALAAPALASYFDATPAVWARLAAEGKTAFAFILSPGATQRAETRSYEVVELVKRRALGKLPIFGMSASDEMRFEQNFVLAGDRAIADGLLVAVFETQLRFGIALAHGMQATGLPLRVTAASGNDVQQLDGRPAADVYAEHFGVARASLDGVFVARATRTMVGMPGPLGSHLPNAARAVTPGGGLRFMLPVLAGSVLTRLEVDARTCVTAAPEAFRKACARAGSARPALALTACCAMRPVLLGDAAAAEIPSMVSAAEGAAVVGFVSCGEAAVLDDGVPQQVNAVIATLVIADELSHAAQVARENEELRRSTAALRQQTREELERLVSQRTAQLQAANAQLVGEVEQRRRMTAQLMQADRLAAIGTLAAGVGHEINNPLSYVMSGVESLAELVGAGVAAPDRVEEAKGLVREVRQGLERIRRTVRDLRVFSRADEGGRPVELQAVLESTLHMAHNDIRHRARLVREYGPTPLVSGSEGRLGQVFLNLVVNASQAIPDGAADRNEIRVVTSTDPEGNAVVEIRDTGPGIPPEHLSRIFEPFFTTKPAGEGTGLGLAICRSIVQGMGGDVTVESAKGQGSAFRVRLPAAARRDLPRAAAPPPPAPAEAARGRVLVVDDDPLVARSVKRMLAREHDVTAETSARAALKRLEDGERYEVVLCDVMMPQMSGPEFHGALRRSVPEQAARLVFVTGGAFTAPTADYLEQAGVRVVEKPFDADALQALVRELVRAVQG